MSKQLWVATDCDFHSKLLNIQFKLSKKRSPSQINKIKNFIKWLNREKDLLEKKKTKFTETQILQGLQSTLQNIRELIYEKRAYPPLNLSSPTTNPDSTSRTSVSTLEGGGGQKRTRDEIEEVDYDISHIISGRDLIGDAEGIIESLINFLKMADQYKTERHIYYLKACEETKKKTDS